MASPIPSTQNAPLPPAIARRALETYERLVEQARPYLIGGQPTAADKHGLRRRVASILGCSAEQVADALARRDLERRPRHPITRGIE